jgi:hypothetical protein
MTCVVVICEGPDLTNAVVKITKRIAQPLNAGALIKDLAVKDLRERVDLLPVSDQAHIAEISSQHIKALEHLRRVR